MNTTSESKPAQEPELTLKPARIELGSPRIQMILAAILALFLSIYLWSGALSCGFLLDDFLHLDYVNRAFHGDQADFLNNFTGNWANSPLMQSYRPLVSVSFFLDYLFYGSNAWGYHLSNLLLHFACALLTGLLAFELTGLMGNRLKASAAIWSMLLFAVYPLHLEATAWIVGRVDLLSTLFYLASLFAYLRFRLLKEKFYFFASLVSFALAFVSKEMAVTLPLVITACEILLYPLFGEDYAGEAQAKMKSRRITAVLSFWFVLGILWTLRIFALSGVVIGGYGGKPLAFFDSFKESFRNGSIRMLLFPVNLDLIARIANNEYWALKDKIIKVLSASYLLILAGGLWRCFCRANSIRIIAFLAFFMLVSVLPTYQIWAISPNLVGSRLFFLGSAPFVILLSFLALPAIDALKPAAVKIFSATGALGLLMVFCIWSALLRFDLQAWTGAARTLKSFKTQLLVHISEQKTDQNTDQKTIQKSAFLLLNLPSDYSGAGMLTRGQYLDFLLKEPNSRTDLSKKVEVLELPDQRSAKASESKENYNYSRVLLKAVENGSRLLLWKAPEGIADSGKLAVFHASKSNLAQENIKLPENGMSYYASDALKQSNQAGLLVPLGKVGALKAKSEKEWVLAESGGRIIRRRHNALRIRPGVSEDLLLFCNTKTLSPLLAQRALIEAKVVSAERQAQLALIWSTANTGAANAAACRELEFKTLAFQLASEPVTLALAENRDWALSGDVNCIGLLFPRGDYEIELSGITISD